MRIAALASLASLATLAISGLLVRPAVAEPVIRLSGPYTHANLSVYMVHGAGAEGPVPLTLSEAMVKGQVQVIETGRVNELEIENTGADEVFVQAGDIVKGGQQDRVLTVSLLLPARSGRRPIASFCVEQGRWAARGKEDVRRFASAADAMPSREAKLAMLMPTRRPVEPMPTAPAAARAAAAGQTRNPTPPQRRAVEGGATFDTGARQSEVWKEVARTQSKLSRNLGATVADRQSATSLQLALENEKLAAARAGYLSALEGAAGTATDIVGYVIAINGRIASGDVYPSAGLLRKMWPKQLNAAVTEAIGEAEAAAATVPPPAGDQVLAFLATATTGRAEPAPAMPGMAQETRETDTSLVVEAKRADGRFVHRSYLAK